jgi:hypothetical protein
MLPRPVTSSRRWRSTPTLSSPSKTTTMKIKTCKKAPPQHRQRNSSSVRIMHTHTRCTYTYTLIQHQNSTTPLLRMGGKSQSSSSACKVFWRQNHQRARLVSRQNVCARRQGGSSNCLYAERSRDKESRRWREDRGGHCVRGHSINAIDKLRASWMVCDLLLFFFHFHSILLAT